ncbi:MAG: flavodoxin domain-containing protein [Bacillota bacterium]|nr:flavodoxin domain-containing protein [Bacillota bacterium]
MTIIYESKTGFTEKYAKMLAKITGLKAYNIKDFNSVKKGSDVVFLGWISAGRVKGLKKALKNFNVKAVCASGTGRGPEPNSATFVKNNNIEGKEFFYLRGGNKPIREIKGFDKVILSMFLKMLKSKKDKTDDIIEAINNIESGVDYVKEENLAEVVKWVNKQIK